MNSGRATMGSWPASQRVVLACGDKHFTVKDALDAAWVRGALNPHWARFLEAHTLETAAAELERDPDPESLQSMSEEFRYTYDLLTAEETEKWLSARDLSEEDFAAYFSRAYWLDHRDELPDREVPGVTYPQANVDLLEKFRIDLILSGDLEALVEQFCWRVAALGHASSDRGLDSRPQIAPGAELRGAMPQLDRDDAWLAECLQMEQDFSVLSEQWLSEEERARALVSRRPGLTQVEIESLLAPNRDAAQEAVMCLKENQASME